MKKLLKKLTGGRIFKGGIVALLVLALPGVASAALTPVPPDVTITSTSTNSNGYDLQSGGVLTISGSSITHDFAGGEWRGFIRPQTGNTAENKNGTLTAFSAALGNDYVQANPVAAGGTFLNSATVNFDDAATAFSINTSTRFENQGQVNKGGISSLTFRASTNNTIDTGHFVNAGTFSHTGTGTVRFQDQLGTGRVYFKQTTAGTLNVTGGGKFISDREIDTTGFNELSGLIDVSTGSVAAFGPFANDATDAGKAVFALDSMTRRTIANLTVNADLIRVNNNIGLTIATGGVVGKTNSPLTLATGSIELQGGTLRGSTIELNQEITGNGTLLGDVNLTADMVPSGSSLSLPGIITTTGDLFAANGFFELQLFPGPSPSNDKLVISGDFAVDTMALPFIDLSVVNPNALEIGQAFQLFDITGSKAGLSDLLSDLTDTLSFLEVPSGGVWSTSSFLTTGTISIVAIPEPTVAVGVLILSLTIGLKRVRL